MYVNDLPLFTEFLVTMCAPERYFMLSYKHLDSLEEKVNAAVAKINYCVRINTLFLNYSETNHMLIYKNILVKISDSEFNVYINQNLIQWSARLNT